MDTKAKRGPVGKLALWAFYAFCAYFVWAMVRYWWIVGRIQSVPGASIGGQMDWRAAGFFGAGDSGVNPWGDSLVHASPYSGT